MPKNDSINQLYQWQFEAFGRDNNITVEYKGARFRMHFDVWPLEKMLKRASKNRSQCCTDGPITVRIIHSLKA